MLCYPQHPEGFNIPPWLEPPNLGDKPFLLVLYLAHTPPCVLAAKRLGFPYFWSCCSFSLWRKQLVKELRFREGDALAEAQAWRDRLEAQQAESDQRLDTAREEVSELQAQASRSFC